MKSSPRVRLRRAEQVERNRQLLLDAALQVFREQGYSGATLDTIAERAGFSKGAVYSQFASKADLFLTLLEARIEERAKLQTRGLSRRARALGPERLVREFFAESRQDPRWRLAVLEFRVVAARDPALNERYRRAHQRTIEGSRQVTADLVAATGFTPKLSLDALAMAALAIDVGGCLEDATTPGAFTDRDAAATVMALLVPEAAAPAASRRARPRRRQ